MNEQPPDDPYRNLGEQIAEVKDWLDTAEKLHRRLYDKACISGPDDVLYCMTVIKQAVDGTRKPLKAIRKEAARHLKDLVKPDSPFL